MTITTDRPEGSHWDALPSVAYEALEAHVRSRGDASFPEAIGILCEAMAVDVPGDYLVENATDGVVFDAGLSEAAVELAIDLLCDQRFSIRGLSDFEMLIIYGFDGSRMLELPLVKRLPTGGYKRPHWCPTLVKLPAGR
jgi:hypothetical protein